MQKHSSDVDMLLDRARSQPVAPPQGRAEERRVYKGDPQSKTPGYAVRPNRKAVRRNRSTFHIVLVLFGCGAGIVLYVSNILQVNRLALEANQLQTRYDKMVSDNQVIRAEIDRKSGWDRISKIAVDDIGLRYPKEQPIWFDVDRKRIEDLSRTSLKQAVQ